MRLSPSCCLVGASPYSHECCFTQSCLILCYITLPTEVHIVKAMVFPVVMHECNSWTVKEAEHWRIGAFKLWYWRRPLRVPWTARRSNQSVLKEINPKYSFIGNTDAEAEAPIHWPPNAEAPIHWPPNAEAPILWPPNAKSGLIGKDPDAGKDGRQEEKGWQRMRWLDDITNSKDMSMSKPWETVKDKEAWRVAAHGVAKSWTWLRMTEQQPWILEFSK